MLVGMLTRPTENVAAHYAAHASKVSTCGRLDVLFKLGRRNRFPELRDGAVVDEASISTASPDGGKGLLCDLTKSEWRN